MSQSSRTILRFTLIFLLVCVPAFAQRRGSGARAYTSHWRCAYLRGRWGWYGGYGLLPFVQFAS